MRIQIYTQLQSLTPALASPLVWQIELHNGQDNRLTRAVLTEALAPALDIVEKEWRTEYDAARAVSKEGKKPDANTRAGALVIVGKLSQDKFFSNGEEIAAS